jgi:U3 small nucleolar RNA-associated protein 14
MEEIDQEFGLNMNLFDMLSDPSSSNSSDDEESGSSDIDLEDEQHFLIENAPDDMEAKLNVVWLASN